MKITVKEVADVEAKSVQEVENELFHEFPNYLVR